MCLRLAAKYNNCGCSDASRSWVRRCRRYPQCPVSTTFEQWEYVHACCRYHCHRKERQLQNLIQNAEIRYNDAYDCGDYREAEAAGHDLDEMRRKRDKHRFTCPDKREIVARKMSDGFSLS